MTDRYGYKPAARLGLHSLPPGSGLDRCYMRELGSCAGPISGEHLITEAIIKLLADEGEFTFAGLPWQKEGEFQSVGLKSFVAKCLCQKHNSALSPLDEAALYFFTSLKGCLERDSRTPLRTLVNAHDVERWILKTAKALAASGNLAKSREKLSGAFATDVQVLEMLDDPQKWPDGAGLYCTMLEGQTTYNHKRFQLQPYTNDQDEISGLGVNILGLSFVLMLEPPDERTRQLLKHATFRPGHIMVSQPRSANWVGFSWDDSRAHHNTMSLKFVREVPNSETLGHGERVRLEPGPNGHAHKS